jgi:hypothetical protein
MKPNCCFFGRVTSIARTLSQPFVFTGWGGMTDTFGPISWTQPYTYTVNAGGTPIPDTGFLRGGYQSYPKEPPYVRVSGPAADSSETDTIVFPADIIQSR